MKAAQITDQALLMSAHQPGKCPPDHYQVWAVYDNGRYITFTLHKGERAYRKWADEYGMRFLSGAHPITLRRVTP